MNSGAEKEYENMTPTELKKICRKHNLWGESLSKTKEGKRKDLIEQLNSLYPDGRGEMVYKGPLAMEKDTDEKDLEKLTVNELRYLVSIRNQNRPQYDQIQIPSGSKKEYIVEILKLNKK